MVRRYRLDAMIGVAGESRGRESMAKKKRKVKLEAKYVRRRFLLLLALLAVVGGGVGLLVYSLTKQEPAAEPVAALSTPAPSSSATEPEVSTTSEEASDPPEESTEEVDAVQTADWNLLLVNKLSPLPEDFTVELEAVVGDYKVDTRIREPLLRMIAEAREDGIVLMICSAHRSPEYQTTLFDNYKNNLVAGGMDEEEAVAATAIVITNPGTSEHHTGLAVDIVTPEYQVLDEGFAETPAFAWLRENAASYGFILRYPQNKEALTDIIYEPWHYRYVGTSDAAIINAYNYCLEEYIYALNTGALNDTSEEEGEESPSEDSAGEGGETADE
jgi:D-alanyl-D-alanine carboxypeptidase